MQYSMMSSETISFIYESEHILSKWKNTRSNIQVLTEIKKIHYNKVITVKTNHFKYCQWV